MNVDFKELIKESYSIVKCVIIKPDGKEIWIKKENDILDDYQVLDKIIEGKYVFEEVYVVNG